MKQPVADWIRNRGPQRAATVVLAIAVAGLAESLVQTGVAQPEPSPNATPSLSATAAVGRVEEIFKLFESGDYSVIGPLVQTSFTPDFVSGQGENDLISELADDTRRIGGIHRGKILPNGDGAIGYFKSNLTEQWGAIILSVEPASPHRISWWQIVRAKAPKSAASAAPSSEKARLAQVAALASKLTKAQLFSGVIAIARNDHLIFTKAYGLANRSFGVANTVDTRFALGDIDKSFTAIAIAQLVEAGKLSYDDPLSKFIAYPDPANAGKIKIKHLLSQTSGLGDYVTAAYFAKVRGLKNVQSYLSILDHRAPGFQPGTNWQSSSIGFLLLGRIVEIASGEDYYEYVQHHIFQPAGMQHSFQDYFQRPNPNSAVRYEDYFEKDHFVTSIYGYISPPPARGAPDSATVSTAEDMVRFVAALRNGKLVSPATYQLMTTPKPELGAKTYGFGFQTNEANDEGRDVIGHAGDARGICTDYALIRDLKEPYTVVMLSNASTIGHAITETIVSLYGNMPTHE